MTTTTTTGSATPHLRTEDCRVADLVGLLERERTDVAAYPHAERVEQGVLVYAASTVLDADAGRREERLALEAELAHAWLHGPGIVVVEGALDAEVVDRVTVRFEELITQQRAEGQTAGDHFAAPGANDRVWGALEKLAVADPHAFVDYYASPVIALAARAWLGPGYQVTSQVNVVGPGGAGQTVHRDYHLGFTSPEVSAAYPAHVHALSPQLTLQGAVAHGDMPVESGPTLYLPHSQKYPHGFLAYWLPDFQEHFAAHHVQLPLRLGDAVFFNPGLFHAAGSNSTRSTRRMANLLQISSAFGRAMESTDRRRVVEAVYPALLEAGASGHDERLLHHAVAASAEAYAFPTNLDRDPPVDGMSPATQAEVVRAALAERAAPAELGRRLAEHEERRRTS